MNDRALRNRWLADRILPHEPWLRRVIARQAMAAGLEVDDLIQEMYAILARLPNVDQIDDPRSYALQAARSLVLQHLRRAKIIPFDSLSERDELVCATDYPTPERHALARVELKRVVEAIEAMPGPVMRAFKMRRVEGLPQREIAERLGLSVNTVEKQISRGIKILVDRFARGGGALPRASSDDDLQHTGHILDDAARVRSDDR